jgi:hypothetical protein
MKFYNLTKLDVKIGDIVYNEEGNPETIHQLTKESIVTHYYDGDWHYSIYGIYIEPSVISTSVLFIPYLIINALTRIVLSKP